MNARDLALLSLDAVDLPDWPRDSLASSRAHGREGASDPRDIDLAARIENATLKNLLRLNHLIAYYADRPLAKIDARVRKILGVALAQILFLDRIPHSAAVDEAVKQARRFGRTSAAGFVNAVLRNATRQPPPAPPGAEENPREYARLVLSHPPELFDRLEKLLGPSDALQLCEHNNRRPTTILRLSPGVSIEELATEGITLTPHESPGMIVVHPTPHALLRRWAEEDLAQAQDPTAVAVVDDCDLQPGQRVLDRCCGLGTKTIQLRQRVGENGIVIAIDPDARRIETLRSLATSRRFSNIHPIHGASISDAKSQIPADGFDRVLIDIPCSNSGVLARRSAARYFQTNDNIASLANLQWRILTDTSPAVARGGLLIYSTCSIWPEENEQMIQRFLESHREFQLEHQHATLPKAFKPPTPHIIHDGGYVAVLKRDSCE